MQNGSLNSTNEERSKVHDELVDALKKAFINKVDIPVLPSSFIDDGDSYIYVKMNVINSGDKNVNASNFVIPYQTGGSVIREFGESGTETINDGRLFIRADAGSYNITSEPQEVHYFVNSQDVGNPALMALLKSYSTSYSEGCSGQISSMEIKNCVITKKYTTSINNNTTDTATKVTDQLTILNGTASSESPAYKPSVLTVKKGETITIKNDDLVPHTITSGTGAEDPNSGNSFNTGVIMSRQSGSIDTSYLTVGEYPYYCTDSPIFERKDMGILMDL